MSSRGQGSRGGPRLLSQPKFAGRRSAAARQELEKAEAEKRRAEQAANATNASRGSGRFDAAGAGRGRGDSSRGRGRGRGGFVGENDRSQSGVVASGPFSSGQATGRGLFAGARNFGGWRGSHGDSKGSGIGGGSAASSPFGGGYRQPDSHQSHSSGRRVKQEPGVVQEPKQSNRHIEDGGYISSDEDEGGPGINIEDFAFVDLTKDDATVGDAFAPIRVPRIAHKGRMIGINADGATNKDGQVAVDTHDAATSEKKPGRQKIKNEGAPADTQRFMPVYEDSATEDERDVDQKDVNDRPTTPDNGEKPMPADLPQAPLTSPERNRRAKQRAKAPPSAFRLQKVDYQTPEEIAEWELHQRDLDIIQSELGVPTSTSAPDATGDAQMSNTQDTVASSDKRANKVYLFQFPPVLPGLAPVKVKADPDSADPSSAVPQPMDLDKPEEAPANDDNPVVQDATVDRPVLPAGCVGKLRIHASGRATLDWGGTSFALGMGADANFLQDILVADLPDMKPEVKTEGGVAGPSGPSKPKSGLAVSMGQVKGKFIVTPDWDEIMG